MTFLASAPGEFGALRLASAEVAYDDTTVDLDSLAVGDVVVAAWVEVTETFDGTAPALDLGDGTTADKYVANADVTEGTLGVYPVPANGPHAAEAAAGTLRATVTTSGASQGTARFYALISAAPA